MAQIQVRDDKGNGIPHINIRISEDHNPQELAIYDIETDLAGNQGWPIPYWPKHPYTLYLNVANVNPTYGTGEVMVTADQGDVQITLPHTGIPTPIEGEHGFLRTQAQMPGFVFRDGLPVNFIDDAGNPWLFAGDTMHTIMCNLKKGEDITPVIDESVSYPANTIVSIGTHLSQWKRDNGLLLDPRETGYANLLAQWFDYAASRKLRVAHAVLADAQGLTASEQQRIWQMSCEVAKGRWNVLLRIGNESDVNGWDPLAFTLPDLGGVLASRGTGGGKAPGTSCNSYWQWAEWEGRRGPIFKALDDAGAGILELQIGYTNSAGERVGPFPIPLVGIEHAFFNDTPKDWCGDDRWIDPKQALAQGLNVGSNCAGGAFGSSQHMVGRLNGPIAAECARQYFRGLRASFLR